MPTDQVFAFVIFAVVAAITPGPSNVMIAATGGAVGFLRGLPCALGAAVGMGVLLGVSALGLGQVILAYPAATSLLKWAGAAFLLWLAWRIATAGPMSENADGKSIGFVGAALFQWLNPKGWLVAISAAGTYLAPAPFSPFSHALILGALFCLAAFPAGSVWLGLGALLRSFLRNPRTARLFNVTMGVALAASVLLMVR